MLLLKNERLQVRLEFPMGQVNSMGVGREIDPHQTYTRSFSKWKQQLPCLCEVFCLFL